MNQELCRFKSRARFTQERTRWTLGRYAQLLTAALIMSATEGKADLPAPLTDVR
jgi:hypothetical protein